MRFGYFSHVWGRPGVTPADRYRELWREIQLADETGFDYAFSVEHHFSPQESWMPSPTIFCTGAAMSTKRIRIGPMGYIPALYNPIGIAEEVAALDQVLGGRLELGITPGLIPGFFGPFGVNFEERKLRVRECVELLRTAFAAEDGFTFHGPFHSYDDLTLSVRPVQRPHPPLWVPTGDRRTLRWLASIGAYTSSTMIVPRRALAVLNGHYLDWWDQAGHQDQPNIGYWAPVYVAHSDEEAIGRGGPHIVHTLTKTLRYGGQAAAAGGRNLTTESILANAGDISFLLDNNLVFAGYPRTVTERIKAAASEGLFNTLLGEFNLGLMTGADIAESVRLFATEVAPSLRGHEPTDRKGSTGMSEIEPRPGQEPRQPAGSPASAGHETADGAYDPDEERLVAERLQALGYLG